MVEESLRKAVLSAQSPAKSLRMAKYPFLQPCTTAAVTKLDGAAQSGFTSWQRGRESCTAQLGVVLPLPCRLSPPRPVCQPRWPGSSDPGRAAAVLCPLLPAGFRSGGTTRRVVPSLQLVALPQARVVGASWRSCEGFVAQGRGRFGAGWHWRALGWFLRCPRMGDLGLSTAPGLG